MLPRLTTDPVKVSLHFGEDTVEEVVYGLIEEERDYLQSE